MKKQNLTEAWSVLSCEKVVKSSWRDHGRVSIDIWSVDKSRAGNALYHSRELLKYTIEQEAKETLQ